MRAPLALIPLCWGLGCAPEDAEVEAARRWIGVYEIDRYQRDTETCSPDGPDADPPRDLVQLDIRLFDTLHEVNLRPCVSADDCVSVPWFQILVEDFPPKQLQGFAGDYSYVGASGSGECNLWFTRGVLIREGDDGLRAEMRTRTVTALPVLDEEDCARALEEMAADDLCDAYHVVEMTRIR